MNIREDLKNKKPVIGNNLTLKKLRKNEIKKIYMASNYSKKENIIRNAKAHNVNVIELKENNKQLGGICKKPFSISIISFE